MRELSCVLFLEAKHVANETWKCKRKMCQEIPRLLHVSQAPEHSPEEQMTLNDVNKSATLRAGECFFLDVPSL